MPTNGIGVRFERTSGNWNNSAISIVSYVNGTVNRVALRQFAGEWQPRHAGRGIAIAPAYVDFGFAFDGVNGAVNVPPSPSLKLTTAVSLLAWIYPTAPIGAPSASNGGGIIMSQEGEYEIARWGDGTIRYALASATPGSSWIDTGYVAPTMSGRMSASPMTVRP